MNQQNVIRPGNGLLKLINKNIELMCCMCSKIINIPANICSTPTMEKLEKGVKHVQS